MAANNGAHPGRASLARRAANFIAGIFHRDSGKGMEKDALRNVLMEGEKSGLVESNERTMVEGVFYLGDRPVGAFMTHRSEIQWLDINTPAQESCAKVLEYREQRCFPVADGTLDAVIGAAYLEDIIIDHFAGPRLGLRAIMKKAQFVPQTMPAIKAFDAFRRAQANYIFVMDEYGGFAGLLSIRDLTEEIVGELTTSRPDEDVILAQEDGTWLADGGINIDDAAEQLSLPDPLSNHGDYHTLAGFVLSLAEELPRAGDSFAYNGFKFTVAAMDGNRIDKIRISKEQN